MVQPQRVKSDELDGTTSVDSLVADLGCNDVWKCRRARRALVAMGESAVQPLLDTLLHRKGWARWEAAKALSQIDGFVATEALVQCLDDRSFDVRWIAAEGLIPRGNEALLPLLRKLIDRSDSSWMREGAHHVLHDLTDKDAREMARPVIAALEDVEPSLEVQIAASALLRALEQKQV